MLVIIVFFFVTLAQATFAPSDLPDPFLRRRGRNCPNFLEFAHTSLQPPTFSQVLILDKPCTAGELSYDSSEDIVSRYLSAVPPVGDTLTIFVEEALECPGITFQPGALFTFVKSSEDVDVNFSSVFGRNGTVISEDGEYTFVKDEETLIINDQCLYTRLTAEEINRQRGECFPRDALITAINGVRPIHTLQIGDLVHDGRAWTRVLGWTHNNPYYVGWFKRIVTKQHSVTLSKHHFIYADQGLITAAHVTIGMNLSGNTVTTVEDVVSTGLYNVQTISGDILVHGLKCSTYTNVVRPVVAHALLVPVRMAMLAGIDLLSWLNAFFAL